MVMARIIQGYFRQFFDPYDRDSRCLLNVGKFWNHRRQCSSV